MPASVSAIRALGVGVVDPKHELAVALVGETPVGRGGQRTAEMQRAGRARREADAHHVAQSRALAGVASGETHI